MICVMIDGRQIHGGFADRIRGIVSIWKFCKDRNIPFRINYTMPFNLQDYLEPNKYNWIPRPGELCYNYHVAQPVCLQEWMFPHKWHKKYLEKRWKKDGKKSLHVYTNSHFHYDVFGDCFNELFKPAPRLQEQIDYYKKNIGGDYIAMVFRFQQLLGDFKEGIFKILNSTERETLISKCIDKVNELHRNGEKILVTSDSSTFLKRISELDFVYTISGEVVHIDYTDDANYNTYLKSFIDFYMIANAQKIFLLKTGDMFQSGFPKTASKVYNRPFKTILF